MAPRVGISAVLLTGFSALIMSYIALATGIGPWIETTLVLMGMLLGRIWYSSLNSFERIRALGLGAVAGGIGGITAVGCGFTFPTYYFLDPQGFSLLLKQPLQFAGIVSGISFVAGACGLLTAYFYGPAFLARTDLPFPIGELVYKMIIAADNFSKALHLALGFIGTQLLLATQLGFGLLRKPFNIILERSWGAFSVPRIEIPLDQLPLFWSIGFVTGHVIALPLLVGLVSKMCIIDPLYYGYPHLSTYLASLGMAPFFGESFFSSAISSADFTIAFCSGLVLFGALESFMGLPRMLKSAYDTMRQVSLFSNRGAYTRDTLSSFVPIFLVLILTLGVFSLLQLSLPAQGYLIACTILCNYQLMMIAGKFGLAPMGRFATFVVVPGMLMFGLTPLQITCASLYVEVAGGVACDALFGRKMGEHASIKQSDIIRYQWIGLGVASLVIGGIFLALIGHFGLGSEVGALAATRSASRALLVSIKSFNGIVLVLGFLFGYLVSWTKVSPALLLAGILMPISYSLMLIAGGLSTYLVSEKEEYYPFWSGVFAANSLWMLLRAFL